VKTGVKLCTFSIIPGHLWKAHKMMHVEAIFLLLSTFTSQWAKYFYVELLNEIRRQQVVYFERFQLCSRWSQNIPSFFRRANSFHSIYFLFSSAWGHWAKTEWKWEYTRSHFKKLDESWGSSPMCAHFLNMAHPFKFVSHPAQTRISAHKHTLPTRTNLAQ